MTKRDKMQAKLNETATRNGHHLRAWARGRWGFNTTCAGCGAFVAITVSTGEQREGHRLLNPCGVQS